jgi:hypothetical protein
LALVLVDLGVVVLQLAHCYHHAAEDGTYYRIIVLCLFLMLVNSQVLKEILDDFSLIIVADVWRWDVA